jgi:hypothetical protein
LTEEQLYSFRIDQKGKTPPEQFIVQCGGMLTSGNREIAHTRELTRYEKGTISSPREIKNQQEGKDDELSPARQRPGAGRVDR